MKSKRETLNLLREVRADYVAMARDCHALRKSVKPFEVQKLPLVGQMDAFIAEFEADLRHLYGGKLP